MVAYINEPALTRLMYGLPMVGWTTVATMLEAEGIPVRADWLPAMPALMRSLRPAIGASSADAGGITSESYQALPFSVFDTANFGTTMAVGTLLPALGRARQLARQAVSVGNLRAIGLTVAMYQLEHRDVAPPNLQALVDEALLEPKHLISPVSDQPYVYIRPSSSTRDSLIVAYDPPVGHKQEKVAVLFRGTNVEMLVVDAEFHELVAKSEAAAAAAGNP